MVYCAGWLAWGLRGENRGGERRGKAKGLKKAKLMFGLDKVLIQVPSYKPASANTWFTISCASFSIKRKCSSPLKLSQ